MEFISGEPRNQITLLPDSIDDYVDATNPVRVIDAYINSLRLEDLEFANPTPNDTGRPMYSPKDLLKLYVYGYMNRTRSSRRLETETKRNLEVIWLLGKLSPDHKTIARFRHDNTAALRNVFRDFVKLCMKLNLYGKELQAIDGSKFKAVNSKDRNFCDKKLKERLARIEEKIKEYMSKLDDADQKEDTVESKDSSEEIAGIISEFKERKELYLGYSDELKQSGESQKSLTDPDSRKMLNNGKMDICYNVHTAVDSKNCLITEFSITNSSTDHNQATPLAEKAKEILEINELTVVVDAGYDSVQDILSSKKQNVDIHVARTDFDICIPSDKLLDEEIVSHKNGRSIYLAERNIALCPMGKILHPRCYSNKAKSGVFYNPDACKICSCKCTKASHKLATFPMARLDFSKKYDDSNLFNKQIRIVANKELIRKRKTIVEHPFGTIKRNMDAGYFLTKGFSNVIGEVSITFLAYNLKRATNILGVNKLIEAMQA